MTSSNKAFPAIRYGNTVVWKGGYSRNLTLRERFRLWRNPDTTIRP